MNNDMNNDTKYEKCIKEKQEASDGCTELSCMYHGKKNREIHKKYFDA